MNLRDKLNAVSGMPKKRPSAPQKTFTDCYCMSHTHPLDEFPFAQGISREAVMLMQNEEMPLPFSPDRILYLDTETTGFQGAGTVAFMVGVGWMGEDGFEIRQYVMRDYPEEPFVLQALDEALKRCDMICTFNGRTFDVPLLRNRYLMNRMKPDLLDKPHIDLLHIARRVWKLRLQQCTLGHLEEAVLGAPRLGDLPGSEAPQRYFSFLKTGQFSLLYDVLAHNEQDIASLCQLLAHLCEVYGQPRQLCFQEDVFSMGLALDRMGHPTEARQCYRLVSAAKLRPQSQMRLAASYRREGERAQAKEVWLGMLARHEGGVEPMVELAKHYEHVERDLDAALELTRRAMACVSEPGLDGDALAEQREALKRRYERLRRKQAQRLRESEKGTGII